MAQISDTAFLTSWERSLDPELSKDVWAKLWVTDAIRAFGENFIKRVAANDAVALALRNRYFLEALLDFEKQHESFLFLNMAAGFTMYPFLMSSQHQFVEVDFPHVIDLKQQRLQSFEQTQGLPPRDIHFSSMDLNRKDIKNHLQENLKISKKDQLCFTLLEGILYYLEKEAIDRIFSCLKDLLPNRSRVGLVSIPSHLANSKTIISTKKYFEDKLGFPQQNYSWLDDDYFYQLDGFSVVDQTNYSELEEKYCETIKGISPENSFYESLFLLEKMA